MNRLLLNRRRFVKKTESVKKESSKTEEGTMSEEKKVAVKETSELHNFLKRSRTILGIK